MLDTHSKRVKASINKTIKEKGSEYIYEEVTGEAKNDLF